MVRTTLASGIKPSGIHLNAFRHSDLIESDISDVGFSFLVERREHGVTDRNHVQVYVFHTPRFSPRQPRLFVVEGDVNFMLKDESIVEVCQQKQGMLLLTQQTRRTSQEEGDSTSSGIRGTLPAERVASPGCAAHSL